MYETTLRLQEHPLLENKPYLLTPWSRVLLEKLTGSAVSQEIPRIFGTRSSTPYSQCPVHNVLKDVVYRRKVRDLADLRQHIIEAVELITPHMLINTWQELEYRLDICRATTCAHIEVYGRA